MLEISTQLFLLELEQGKEYHYKVVENGLPNGCKIVGRGYDYVRDVFWIHIEHDSFPEVPEGHLLETVNPAIQDISLTPAPLVNGARHCNE